MRGDGQPEKRDGRQIELDLLIGGHSQLWTESFREELLMLPNRDKESRKGYQEIPCGDTIVMTALFGACLHTLKVQLKLAP